MQKEITLTKKKKNIGFEVFYTVLFIITPTILPILFLYEGSDKSSFSFSLCFCLFVIWMSVNIAIDKIQTLKQEKKDMLKSISMLEEKQLQLENKLKALQDKQ